MIFGGTSTACTVTMNLHDLEVAPNYVVSIGVEGVM